MIRFYITRHGETLWNTQKRMQGRKDSPLTDMGRKQAEWLGRALKDVEFEAAYTSSSGRALETARIITAGRNIPVTPTEGLMEIYLGVWEGLMFSEAEKLYPEQFENFWEYPDRYVPIDGESFAEVVERAGRTMETLAESHDGGNLLVVTHTVTLKAIAAYVERKQIKDLWSGAYMKQACLNILEYGEGIWKPVIWGDVTHYEEAPELSEN